MKKMITILTCVVLSATMIFSAAADGVSFVGSVEQKDIFLDEAHTAVTIDGNSVMADELGEVGLKLVLHPYSRVEDAPKEHDVALRKAYNELSDGELLDLNFEDEGAKVSEVLAAEGIDVSNLEVTDLFDVSLVSLADPEKVVESDDITFSVFLSYADQVVMVLYRQLDGKWAVADFAVTLVDENGGAETYFPEEDCIVKIPGSDKFDGNIVTISGGTGGYAILVDTSRAGELTQRPNLFAN